MQPCNASWRVISKPIPLEPPVTNAIFWEKRSSLNGDRGECADDESRVVEQVDESGRLTSLGLERGVSYIGREVIFQSRKIK